MVEKVFEETLKVMRGNPDLVTDSQGRICHAHQPFDEYDDDLMHDLIGNKRLADPIQALLMFRLELKQVQGSFGVDHSKAFESTMKKLDDLYEACKAEWKDA